VLSWSVLACCSNNMDVGAFIADTVAGCDK
jgi:hypothetical protein